MPRPRKLEQYPHEYARLFIEAAYKHIIITCSTPRQAKNLRAQLYQYRTDLFEQTDPADGATLTFALAILSTGVDTNLSDHRLNLFPAEAPPAISVALARAQEIH